MSKTFTLKTSNGEQTYVLPELDFTNVLCDLEDQGVSLMQMFDADSRKDMKVFSVCRAILCVLTGITDKKQAGKIMSEHLGNGGSIDDIFSIFTEAMKDSGFGAAAGVAAGEEKPRKATKATEK